MPLGGPSWSRQQQLDDEDTARRDEFNAGDDEAEDILSVDHLPATVGSLPVLDIPLPSPRSEISAVSGESLQKKLKTSTSPVWDQFPVSIDKGAKTVKCKHCSVCKYTNPSGTSAMIKHLNKNHPGKLKSAEKPPIPKVFQPASNDIPRISKQK